MITVLAGTVVVSEELKGRETQHSFRQFSINYYKGYLNRIHFLVGITLHR